MDSATTSLSSISYLSGYKKSCGNATELIPMYSTPIMHTLKTLSVERESGIARKICLDSVLRVELHARIPISVFASQRDWAMKVIPHLSQLIGLKIIT